MCNCKDIVFLRGPRVVLRPLCITCDVEIITKWINDPDVRRFLSAYLPCTISDESEWINSHSKRKGTTVTLVMVVDGKPIGVMGLHDIGLKDGIGTTGAYIGEAEFREMGYGSEAKMLLLKYAFHELGLRKVYSSVIAYNKRSYQYLLKTGYVPYATRKKHVFRNGKYHDEILLEVWRKDWEELWKEFAKKHSLDK